MIYHLVNDEKVINRTMEIFEDVFPGENLFIVFKANGVTLVDKNKNFVSYKNFDATFEESKRPTSVIIHLMTNRKIKFINKYINIDIPVYWVMWGSDLYNRLLMPKGYQLIDRESTYYKDTKYSRGLKSIIKKMNDEVRILKRIHFINKRVKYLVTSTIEDDYDIITNYYPQLKTKIHKEFSYYPIDQVVGEEKTGLTAVGNNIQIGNCGTQSNNHEYVLRILSSFKIKNRKIVIPLSYSGEKGYKRAVIEKGREFFGDQIEPITNFLPLADYNNLIATCSIAIYGNWRQEAVGNIMMSLYLGVKVFLSKKNPILNWALRHGFIIFELESITQEEIDTPLSISDKENNMTILLSQYDKKELYKSMKSTFNER